MVAVETVEYTEAYREQHPGAIPLELYGKVSSEEWAELMNRYLSVQASAGWVAFFVVLIFIPIVGWLVLFLLGTSDWLMHRSSVRNKNIAVARFNERYAARGVSMQLRTRTADTKYPELYAVFTVDNPGHPCPGVELFALTEKEKLLLAERDAMRAADAEAAASRAAGAGAAVAADDAAAAAAVGDTGAVVLSDITTTV